MSKPLGKRGYCSSIRMDEVLSDEEFEKLKDGRWWHKGSYNGDVNAHVCPDEAERIDRLVATVEDRVKPEHLEDAVQEKLAEMNKDASEFDKDLWRNLRPFLEKCGLDWNNYPDGVLADDAIQYLEETFRSLKEENAKLIKQIYGMRKKLNEA